MWILAVLLCACVVTSSSAFYEPVENNAARRFYKRPLSPPVTVLDYQPPSPGLPATQHSWQPSSAEVSENKPIQQVQRPPYTANTFKSNDVGTFSSYKPPAFKSIPTPVPDPVQHFKLAVPVFTSLSTIPLLGYHAPTSLPTNELPTLPVPKTHVYELSEHEVALNRSMIAAPQNSAQQNSAPQHAAPRHSVPQHVSRPDSHQTVQDATSFQSVVYTVTKQAYRKPTQ